MHNRLKISEVIIQYSSANSSSLHCTETSKERRRLRHRARRADRRLRSAAGCEQSGCAELKCIMARGWVSHFLHLRFSGLALG